MDQKSWETGERLDINLFHCDTPCSDQTRPNWRLSVYLCSVCLHVFSWAALCWALRPPRCSFVWRETSLDHTLIPCRAFLSVFDMTTLGPLQPFPLGNFFIWSLFFRHCLKGMKLVSYVLFDDYCLNSRKTKARRVVFQSNFHLMWQLESPCSFSGVLVMLNA